MSEFARVLRSRLAPTRVATFVLVVAGASVVLGREGLVGLALAMLVGEVIAVADEHSRVPDWAIRFGIGITSTVGGAALLGLSLGAFGEPVGNWLAPPLFAVVILFGSWLARDGWQRRRSA